jgi:glycosyltransferase involved in cell wall biosynthesis
MGVIVQTKTAEGIYRKILPNTSLHVIGNPIRKISPIETIKKENIVLTVGRLIQSKHHDELIKLFVELNTPGWKLIIVGGDALRQSNFIKLQKLVSELNANDRVILTNNQNDVDIFYRRSKIFAFTSSSEGFPNVIGEALSAGLPVVAFDCIAGPSEMIEDGENGFLVPLFDFGFFKSKLVSLMQDDFMRDRMSKNAINIQNRFSKELISEIYLSTITQ